MNGYKRIDIILLNITENHTNAEDQKKERLSFNIINQKIILLIE